ncbi:MAG: LytR C-terminal domain-containing protein [Jiangellaceae bacterium]|nr:LytR C-terminal domain-containing protein [Jiangellaceae bacterium]
MTFRERVDQVWPSAVALLGTVAVVAGLLAVFGTGGQPTGGDDITAAGTGSPSPTTLPRTTEPTPTPAPAELREEVGILNATDTDGLAESARERLEAGGWEVPATDGYSGEIAATTVFYPNGMKESAEALAAQFLEIRQVRPTIPGLTTSRLVLILADDFPGAAEATG